MKAKSLLWATGLALATVGQGFGQTINTNSPRHVEGELLVKFNGGPRGPVAERARATMKHEVKRHFDILGWQQIGLPPGMTVEEGLARYRKMPEVLAVEPNSLARPIASVESPVLLTPAAFAPAGAPVSPAPNDPQFSLQWALAKIDAASAWAITTGSTNVVVAVLDTGVNYNHEDLRDNMWRNPGEIPGNGLDDDGNGYVDDVYGIDALTNLNNDSDPMDEGFFLNGSPFYHGTFCAGLIGAVGNNNKGIAGVNWSVQIMAMRVSSTSETLTIADLVQAFDYLVTMRRRGINIRVTSNSYGVNPYSQAFKDALEAAGNEGIVNVCLAWNEGRDNDVTPNYPGNYNTPGIIVAAASDESDNLASFSNYGRTNVDLAAPGVNITSTFGSATNSYISGRAGTSYSCPYVAGAAALLAAANPGATAEDIKAALLETADVLPAFTNKMVSNGRLNLGRAFFHPKIRSNAPPVVIAQPQSKNVLESNNVTFAVRVVGSSPLSYQWHKDGTLVANATNLTLTLSNLTPQHAGDYALGVSNPYGAVTSAVATLTVLTIPRLVHPLTPLQFSAVPGQTVTLSVETTGTLPIGYRWRHLRTNGSSANLTNLVLQQHTCFLTLNVESNSAGSYTVVLTNAAQTTSGLQRTNAVLTVLADSDGDGLPDVWEAAYPNATDAPADTDHDGLTNLQEYQAGTDPTNALSFLKVDSLSLTGGVAAQLTFFAVSNRTYTVESRATVDTGPWTRAADVLAAATNRGVEIIDSSATPAPAERYYRLATPRVP